MIAADRADLANLIATDFWKRISKEVLRKAVIDPRGNGQDAAKIGLDLAFCAGLHRFQTLLEELSAPPAASVTPQPRHLNKTPGRNRSTQTT